MCCTGKALTVVQTVKTRSGFAAWNALVDEYGKVMIGDRTLLQRRLRTADVHGDGQTGMEEGDDVKDFITKLNALHTELYQTVPVEEHHSVPELTKESMRQVLFVTLFAQDQTHGMVPSLVLTLVLSVLWLV